MGALLALTASVDPLAATFTRMCGQGKWQSLPPSQAAGLYRPGKNGFVKEQNIRGCGPVSCIYTIEEGEQPRSFTYKQMYKENGPQNLIIIIVSETGPYLNIFNCEAQLNKCTFLSVCLSVCPSVSKTEFLIVWSAYDNL